MISPEFWLLVLFSTWVHKFSRQIWRCVYAHLSRLAIQKERNLHDQEICTENEVFSTCTWKTDTIHLKSNPDIQIAMLLKQIKQNN